MDRYITNTSHLMDKETEAPRKYPWLSIQWQWDLPGLLVFSILNPGTSWSGEAGQEPSAVFGVSDLPKLR